MRPSGRPRYRARCMLLSTRAGWHLKAGSAGLLLPSTHPTGPQGNPLKLAPPSRTLPAGRHCASAMPALPAGRMGDALPRRWTVQAPSEAADSRLVLPAAADTNMRTVGHAYGSAGSISGAGMATAVRARLQGTLASTRAWPAARDASSMAAPGTRTLPITCSHEETVAYLMLVVLA